MLAQVLEVAIAPLLVGVASLVAGRFGPRAGGVVSAFPAIAGPFLLLSADRHGTAFAADAATGTLLGLAAFAGYVVAYARMATVAGWALSLLVAWAVAAGLTAALSPVALGAGWSLAACVVALVAAHRALPPLRASRLRAQMPWWDLPARMVLCAALVVALAVASDALGSGVGGLLAALPVLASILAVFTHREDGAAAVVTLLRGMVEGMGAFVAFCAVVAFVAQPWGVAPAFAAATAAAVAITVAESRRRRSDSL